MMVVNRMKCLAVVAGVVGMAGMSSLSWAQTTLVTYDFTTAPGNQATTPATTVVGNMTAASIGRGTGLTSIAGADSINAGSWPTTTTIDPNDYFAFLLTPAPDHGLDVDTIEFSYRRSPSGPLNVVLRSSLDAFAGDITTLTLTNDGSFHRAPPLVLGSAFDGVTSPVEFRIYGHSATNNLGTLRIGGDGTPAIPNTLIVTGAVIPEPTTLALLSVGVMGLVARRRKK
jgi:hypothetical protein